MELVILCLLSELLRISHIGEPVRHRCLCSGGSAVMGLQGTLPGTQKVLCGRQLAIKSRCAHTHIALTRALMLGQLQCIRSLLHLISSATMMQLPMRLCCAVHLQMQQERQTSWSPAHLDGGHNQRQSQESVSRCDVASLGGSACSHMQVSASM